MVAGSKTLMLLKSLLPSEKKELLKFIESPFYNSDKNLVKLYIVLCNGERDSVTIFRKIKGKKYNDQQLRYLLSDLNILIEKYLTVKRFENRKELSRQYLIEELNNRHLDKYIEPHRYALLKHTNSQLLKDSDFLGICFNAEEALFRVSSGRNNRGEQNRLQVLSDTLDAFYFSKKLKYTCEMINRSNVLSVNYDSAFMNEIRSFLPGSRFFEVSAVSIYYHILETLVDPGNEKNYLRLKDDLVRSRKLFSDAELKDMFTFAQNYCIRRLNSGKSEYLEELFSNYSYLLDEKNYSDK